MVGRPRIEALREIGKFSGECKVWELVDDGRLRLGKPAVRRLRELAASYGLEFSVHTPFTDVNIASLNPAVRRVSIRLVKRSIYYASLLEAKVAVVHPGHKGPLEAFQPRSAEKLNLQSVEELTRYASDLGVKLALENMPRGGLLSRVEDFERFFSSTTVEGLSLALDVGHAKTVGQLSLFLSKFKSLIGHVHLHENDGTADQHLALNPEGGSWLSAVETLGKAGFNGYLVVESLEKPHESFKTLKYALNR